MTFSSTEEKRLFTLNAMAGIAAARRFGGKLPQVMMKVYLSVESEHLSFLGEGIFLSSSLYIF